MQTRISAYEFTRQGRRLRGTSPRELQRACSPASTDLDRQCRQYRGAAVRGAAGGELGRLLLPAEDGALWSARSRASPRACASRSARAYAARRRAERARSWSPDVQSFPGHIACDARLARRDRDSAARRRAAARRARPRQPARARASMPRIAAVSRRSPRCSSRRAPRGRTRAPMRTASGCRRAGLAAGARGLRHLGCVSALSASAARRPGVAGDRTPRSPGRVCSSSAGCGCAASWQRSRSTPRARALRSAAAARRRC